MEVTALQRNVNPADLSLDELASSKKVSEEQKIGEVSRQFEAILVREILQQAQKPMFGGSASGSEDTSGANGIYQDMVTERMADGISRSGALGFGKMLEEELSTQLVRGHKHYMKAAAGPDEFQTTD